MTTQTEPQKLFIGWDVGGWNCDHNPRSRDAITILDEERNIVGTPWRGNLRDTINTANTHDDWVKALLTLCNIRIDNVSALKITLAIDACLAFSEAFIALITSGQVSDAIGQSAQNPYLHRKCEQLLFKGGLKPLSPIKDMIGSQATKAMHVLAKFGFTTTAVGVWQRDNSTAIETYPSAAKDSHFMAQLVKPYIDKYSQSEPAGSETINSTWYQARFIRSVDNEDKRDALICALLAWSFHYRPEALFLPDDSMPINEGWIFIPADYGPNH